MMTNASEDRNHEAAVVYVPRCYSSNKRDHDACQLPAGHGGLCRDKVAREWCRTCGNWRMLGACTTCPPEPEREPDALDDALDSMRLWLPQDDGHAHKVEHGACYCRYCGLDAGRFDLVHVATCPEPSVHVPAGSVLNGVEL